MNASEIEEAARPNTPGKQRHVVLGFAEVSGLAIFSAAKPAEKRLAANGRYQRTVNRAVLRMLGGAEKRRALLRFWSRRQSLRDKIAEWLLRRNNRERHDARIARHELDGWIEMQNLNELCRSKSRIFFRSPQRDLVALLLHFHAQRITFESDARAHRAVDLGCVVARCPQRFTRNSDRFVRGGQIEIPARASEDCLLLLRIEAVASSFRKLMGFERSKNCVADIGLSGDRPAGRITLLMNFFDQAFRVLDQVVMAPIRHARRGPRKKTFDCTLLSSTCLGELFTSELHIQILRPGQSQRGGQINRE